MSFLTCSAVTRLPPGRISGEKKPRGPAVRVTLRLRTHFDEVVRKKLVEERGYQNRLQVPVAHLLLR